MSKKQPKPIPGPLVAKITPRLIAAVEDSIGRRLPPGCSIIVKPPQSRIVIEADHQVPAPKP